MDKSNEPITPEDIGRRIQRNLRNQFIFFGVLAIGGLYVLGVGRAKTNYDNALENVRDRTEWNLQSINEGISNDRAILRFMGEINFKDPLTRKNYQSDLAMLLGERNQIQAEYDSAQAEHDSKSPWKSWAYLFE